MSRLLLRDRNEDGSSANALDLPFSTTSQVQVCKWSSIAAFVAWLINMLFYNGSRPWPL